MILHNLCNGGFAEVDDDLGTTLVESGLWDVYVPPAQRAVAEAEEEKPAAAPKRRSTKTAAEDGAEAK